MRHTARLSECCGCWSERAISRIRQRMSGSTNNYCDRRVMVMVKSRALNQCCKVASLSPVCEHCRRLETSSAGIQIPANLPWTAVSALLPALGQVQFRLLYVLTLFTSTLPIRARLYSGCLRCGRACCGVDTLRKPRTPVLMVCVVMLLSVKCASDRLTSRVFSGRYPLVRPSSAHAC
jgi:hypothetical protein